MKIFSLSILLGTMFVGNMAFGESEKEFDYDKNLQVRQIMDQKNIESYSKKNGVSLEVAAERYYEKIQNEFKKNDTIRKDMMKDNAKN